MEDPCSLLDLCKQEYKEDNYGVIYDDGRTKQSLTYKQLSHLSNQLADVLCNYTIGSQVVGICMEIQLVTPAVLLGILKSDAAFYNFNAEALKLVSYVLSQVGCQIILTDNRNLKLLQPLITDLSGTIVPLVLPDYPEFLLVHLTCIQQRVHPTHLAYCITTSGTTGRPKIVKVPHTCVVPNILHLRKIYNLTPADLVLLCSPLTFDPSIVEIFTTLSVGATLLLVPPVVKLSPDFLLDIAHHRNKVTVIQATPTLLSRFGSTELQNSLLGDRSSLRVLSLGGEEFPDGATIQSYKSEKNRTQFINLYGITEVSVWATFYIVTDDDLRCGRPIPLGSCLKDTVIEVRDGQGNCITEGQGELYIGGYKRQCIVLTSEGDDTRLTFRPTGDIVRRDKDGTLYYLHRKDQQLKRNGKRINLEEIRQVTQKCSGVQDSVTLMSDSRLVTFVTVSEKSMSETKDTALPEKTLSVKRKIKQEMLQHLPPHSVPDDVVIIDCLPITSHGKVDMKQLEAWYKQQKVETVHYSTDYLRQKWMELLHVDDDKIDSESNFIELGGTSLSAVNLLNDLENVLGVQLTLLLDKLISESFKDCDVYIHQEIDKNFVDNITDDDAIFNVADVKDGVGLFDKQSAKTIEDGIQMESVSHKTDKRKYGDFDKTSIVNTKGVNENSDIELDVTNMNKRKHKLSRKECLFISAVSKGNQYMTCKNIDKAAMTTVNEIKVEVVKDSVNFTDDDHHHVKENKLKINSSLNNTGKHLFINDKHKAKHRISYDKEIIVTNKFVQHMCSREDMTAHSMTVERECVAEANEMMGALIDGVEFKLEEHWRFDTGKCVDASPLIALSSDGTDMVFIGSHSHKFFAISTATGECQWEVTLGDRIEATACLSLCGHFVIVGCYNGSIYSLDCETGSVWWRFQTGSQVKCSPVIDKHSGLVYVGSHDQSIYCLDIRQQVVVWKNPLNSGSIFSSPAIDYVGCRLFVATLGGKIFCLNKDDGRELWMYDCSKPLFSSLTLTVDGVLAGCTDKCLYSIDLKGNLLWKFSTDAPIFSTPSSFNVPSKTSEMSHGDASPQIVVGSHDGVLYCLSHTGTLCWKTKVSSQVYSTPFYGVMRVPDNVVKLVKQSRITRSTYPSYNDNRTCTVSVDASFGNSFDVTSLGCFANEQSANEQSANEQSAKEQSYFYLGSSDMDKYSPVSDNITDPASRQRDSYPVPVVIFCSTVGVLYVVDARTGHILCETSLPGELFSSPVLHRNSIYVGCRDDYVYKLDLKCTDK